MVERKLHIEDRVKRGKSSLTTLCGRVIAEEDRDQRVASIAMDATCARCKRRYVP